MLKGRRTILILLLVVIALSATFLVVWGQRQAQASRDANKYETTQIRKGSVSATVTATGQVHARQSAVLTWKTSGKVSSIPVKIGDSVQPGQLLASLDPTSLPAALIQARSDLIAAQNDLRDLQQAASNQAKALDNVANAQKALNDLLTIQSGLNQPNASPANQEGAQAGYDLAQAQLNQAEQLYSLVEGLPEDNIQRLQAAAQVLRARRNLDNAQTNLTYATNKPDAQTAARVTARVEVAKATLADAQREWERVKNGPNPDDLKAAQAKIDAIEATLAQANLLAPFAGTIDQLFNLEGDLVKPGTSAMRLEDLKQIHVILQVPEVDINRIRPDQAGAVTFDAIPGRKYTGQVIEVAKFGVSQQGGVVFGVEVMLTNQDNVIRPGMTASVTLTVAQAQNVLVINNQAVRFVNGQRIVYILKDNKPVQIPVSLGVTDDKMSQVISGDLKEGDLLILNPTLATPVP